MHGRDARATTSGMRKILTLENGKDILRRVAAPIKRVTPEIRALVQEMYEVMHEGEGVGLAAPQIGESVRLIVFETEGEQGALINPAIVSREGSEIATEGCLSLPKLNGDVERATEVTVRFMDENGKKRTKTWHDLDARVVQHEMDHLDGVLFTDRAIRGTLRLAKPDDEEEGEEKTEAESREEVGVL